MQLQNTIWENFFQNQVQQEIKQHKQTTVKKIGRKDKELKHQCLQLVDQHQPQKRNFGKSEEQKSQNSKANTIFLQQFCSHNAKLNPGLHLVSKQPTTFSPVQHVPNSWTSSYAATLTASNFASQMMRQSCHPLWRLGL